MKKYREFKGEEFLSLTKEERAEYLKANPLQEGRKSSGPKVIKINCRIEDYYKTKEYMTWEEFQRNISEKFGL